MSSIENYRGSFDPKWGALTTRLQEEGYNPAQIEEAKSGFVTAVNHPSEAVSKEVQALYAKVFPENRNEIILGIKKEVLEFTEQKIKKVLDSNPEDVQEQLSQLLQPGSYIEEKLRELRQLGESSVTGWYFYHTYCCFSSEERKVRVEAVVDEVVRDFFNGMPTSFPMMAHILGDRKIGYSPISHLSPISDIQRSIQLLNCLAGLGEKEAQYKLSFAYTWNHIGSDEQKENLNLPIENRIQGLRRLALAGHAWSQYELGGVCFHERFGHDGVPGMTEEVRRKYIQELWDNEVSHNYYLQTIVRKNRIGDLPYGLSLQQRLHILHERAQKGDENAFRSLFGAYTCNRLDEDNVEESLKLTQTERLEKLNGLRVYSPKLFDLCIADVYRDNRSGRRDDFFEPNFSDSERVQWLEDQALNKDNARAQGILVEAYANNQLCPRFDRKRSVKLQMPLDERIEKLRLIADKGCRDAQYILLQYYGLGPWGDVSGIVGDSQKVEDGLSLPKQRIKVSVEDLFPDLLRWALLGNVNGAQDEIKRIVKDSSKKDALSYLFAVRSTVNWVNPT